MWTLPSPHPSLVASDRRSPPRLVVPGFYEIPQRIESDDLNNVSVNDFAVMVVTRLQLLLRQGAWFWW